MKKASNKKSKTIVKKQKNGDTVIIKKKSTYVPVPPKQHQFKKGQSGNPHGVSKEKVAIKAFTSTQLINAINMVTSLSAEEADQLVQDKTLPLTELVVLRAIVDAAHSGNYSKFYEVVEFILGKIPNKIEIMSSISERLGDKDKVKATLKEIQNEY